MSDEEKFKHINMGVWLRLTGVAQGAIHRDKVSRWSSNGEVEFHFSNQMRKWIQWTANAVATYGGGSMDGQGSFAILDLIGQFEPDPAFNLWVGRMLVPSDRSNFSGPYFMGPWNYPGLGGPREGAFGRNDGATVWGQAEGGLFKYYLGVFDMYGAKRSDGRFSKPLWSGRLNLSLLNPEPGFYNSSTYYGKDILAIGVGGQYQANGTAPGGIPDPSPGVSGVGLKNYSLFNTDLLFEKDLAGSGVLDVEGAFFKYMGDNETSDNSYFALLSYLTPDLAGSGKMQPLVRLQQMNYKSIAGVKPDPTTIVDAQVGYVLDSYSTRFALGLQHSKLSSKNVENALFLGVQLMK